MLDSLNHPQKRAFLIAYAELGNVRKAARLARISRETHYEWKRSDPAYKAAFEDARKQACEALEGDAYRRARFGVRDLMLFEGQPIEWPKNSGKYLRKQRFSDSLVGLLLRFMDREKYDVPQKHEHSGIAGAPIQHEVELDISHLDGLDESDLDTIERIMAKALPRAPGGETPATAATEDGPVLSDDGEVQT